MISVALPLRCLMLLRRRLEKMRMQMEREAKEAEEHERLRKEAVCVVLRDV